jgi:hypothetical protein
VIAVDGWTLSGKSHLGQLIAAATRRRWVDIDLLLARDKETFIDHIDYSMLASLLDTCSMTAGSERLLSNR